MFRKPYILLTSHANCTTLAAKFGVCRMGNNGFALYVLSVIPAKAGSAESSLLKNSVNIVIPAEAGTQELINSVNPAPPRGGINPCLRNLLRKRC